MTPTFPCCDLHDVWVPAFAGTTRRFAHHATNLNAKFSEHSSRWMETLLLRSPDCRGGDCHGTPALSETRLWIRGRSGGARGQRASCTPDAAAAHRRRTTSRQSGCPSRRHVGRRSRSPASRGSTLGPASWLGPPLGLAPPPTLGLASQALGLAPKALGLAPPPLAPSLAPPLLV